MVMGKNHEETNHLFDSNADSDRVDGSLDENLLLVITTDHHRLQ